MKHGDDEFEKMLQLIEKGEKLTAKDIDEFASQTNSSLLEKIISERLNHSLSRLKQQPSIQHNLEEIIPLRDATKFIIILRTISETLSINKKFLLTKRANFGLLRSRILKSISHHSKN